MTLPVNTIIQGDCLEVIKTFPDNSIDFVFMDPPYGHNNNNGDFLDSLRKNNPWADRHADRSGSMSILNDGPEVIDLLSAMLPEISRVLGPGCCCCCCCCAGGGGPKTTFTTWISMLSASFDFLQAVVWDKGISGLGIGNLYRRSYEFVLVSKKPGAATRWTDKTRAIENVIRHIRRDAPKEGMHPNQKPIALAAHFINLHTQPGDIVLDPFCGSGSTLLAAKRNGRQFIGIELDPKWTKHANERLAGETLELFWSEPEAISGQ